MTPSAALFYPRGRRAAGLALALALHLAFLAAVISQGTLRKSLVPDPTRMTLLWVAVPAPAPPAQPIIAAPARVRRPRRAPVSPAPPAPAPIADAPLAPPDPFAEPDALAPAGLDPKAVRSAITATLMEARALEDTRKFVKSPRKPNQYEQFATDFSAAKVPYCTGADPMRLNPPVVKVGKVTIGLGGVLALPFYVQTVAKGKCRMK